MCFHLHHCHHCQISVTSKKSDKKFLPFSVTPFQESFLDPLSTLQQQHSLQQLSNTILGYSDILCFFIVINIQIQKLLGNWEFKPQRR
ncbi:hypothetical protein RIF29_19481 [Crotalaria pallida]|uniref:Uncharacterized protein n=1 Tax=Crotalaria pallida TaxID=3830 RepID=A0AAN9F1C4_CROPI